MKTNYHTHTPHCGHAVGSSTREYAEAACAAGLKYLGFTDHAPFPDTDLGCRMPYEELLVYFDEVEELRAEFKGRMTIYKSVEIEYLPEYTKGENYYEKLLKEYGCDYLLVGEHFFRDDAGKLYNLYNIPGPEIVLDYAKACVEAMSTGYFKMLAHPDLFGVNDHAWCDIYDRATQLIIEGALRYNVILEYNANGYRRGIRDFASGRRYMYPLKNFWTEAAKAGVSVIIGSDSHNPKEIWDYAMPKARRDLKGYGIKPIEILPLN